MATHGKSKIGVSTIHLVNRNTGFFIINFTCERGIVLCSSLYRFHGIRSHIKNHRPVFFIKKTHVSPQVIQNFPEKNVEKRQSQEASTHIPFLVLHRMN